MMCLLQSAWRQERYDCIQKRMAGCSFYSSPRRLTKNDNHTQYNPRPPHTKTSTVFFNPTFHITYCPLPLSLKTPGHLAGFMQLLQADRDEIAQQHMHQPRLPGQLRCGGVYVSVLLRWSAYSSEHSDIDQTFNSHNMRASKLQVDCVTSHKCL